MKYQDWIFIGLILWCALLTYHMMANTQAITDILAILTKQAEINEITQNILNNIIGGG